MVKTFFKWAGPVGLMLAVGAGCDEQAGDPVSDDPACDGGKCDKPGGTHDEQCKLRQTEVLDSSQRGFTRDAIRWACADVEGVNTVGMDHRGQEYCEYYAVVQPPSEDVGVDLGRNKSQTEGDVTSFAVCLEGDEREDCRTTLSEDDMFEWEDNPDSVVGACVFTSWHNDVPGPLPACEEDGCPESAQVFGLPLDETYGRMKVFFNGNTAASGLVQECVNKAANGTSPLPDSWDAEDPLQEPFYRGCMSTQEIFGTGWRRSDPSVCAVANRLVECGCEVPGVDASALGEALVPPQPAPDGSITLRGFRLGTWDDPAGLPGGCRYAEIGEDSRAVVLCDLTAADVLTNLNDPKELCRERYGNQVVVHVPIPADAIRCQAPDTPMGASCGETPWNIGAEG